jgi:hypothetical protein
VHVVETACPDREHSLTVTALAERAVRHVSTKLAKGSTRRSFLAKSAVVGSALAVNPLQYLLRPGTAYAAVCGPAADCASGWTVFCCSVNGGLNACPPGSIPAGWWKTDNSSFCGGGPRYILDCNALCGSCGCGSSGICAPGCYNCGCRCNTGSCDERRHCCNQFRYGQCHQELGCVGPVVCRVATCTPPWQYDPTCTTASATANATALHTAPCLQPDDEVEEDEMWVIEKELPAGSAAQPGEVVIGLPANRKSATVRLFVDNGPNQGASIWGAIVFNGGVHGLWNNGTQWEVWLPAKYVVDASVNPLAHQVILQTRGPAGRSTTVTVSGT